MSQLMNQPVKTFSMGFDEPGYSELPYARLVTLWYRTSRTDRKGVGPVKILAAPHLASR